MIIIKDIKISVTESEQELNKKIIKNLMLYKLFPKGNIPGFSTKIIRKSIDARKKPDIYFVYTLGITFERDEKSIKAFLIKKNIKNISFDCPQQYRIPEKGTTVLELPPVIVGCGPCGLFAAYLLAQKGFNPIVIERGESVYERQATVESSWKSGVIKPDSNVQFGEGGAGTFSDGKLNTLTKDTNGRNSYVLQTFAQFGAPEEITYLAKPHIGTDKLRDVVANMRKEICRLGGTFIFNCRLTGLVTENGKVKGLRVVDTNTYEESVIDTDIVLLCIGHSSRDTFEMLYSAGIIMEPKSFAVGFRVQHPQRLVNLWQYGTEDSHKINLGAADYKVASKASNNRRVYSFCMCPGGYVVNASSEKDRCVVNGMSEYGRDSGYANSAIIVGIDPEDFVTNEVSRDHPLCGMYYQRSIEEKAYDRGNGSICAQFFNDFEKNTASNISDKIKACTKGEVTYGNLRGIFAEDIEQGFIECMHYFGQSKPGFDGEDALMFGVEARTSSPVRILRDEDFICNISGIYPCGEGAGYAGGITSAAADGIRVAEKIITKYNNNY